jgi:hypothetical protein
MLEFQPRYPKAFWALTAEGELTDVVFSYAMETQVLLLRELGTVNSCKIPAMRRNGWARRWLK